MGKADYHRPVLLEESIDLLSICEEGSIVDCTYGGGGHSALILENLGDAGRLIAFDKDADAHANKLNDSRLELIRSDFRFIERELKQRGIDRVDGILADLGISSHHVDAAERGFSFRFDVPLDMRMDQDANLSAVDVLNDYPEADLVQIFRAYGEIRQAVHLAANIVKRRRSAPILTTGDLEAAVRETVAANNLSKILPLVYQAVRIEVNGELDGLREMLEGGLKMLAPGGRFAIISYHSLEDRMVKRFFRSGNLEGIEQKDFMGRSLSPLKVITRKAVKPTDEEIKINPRARSARLRVAEKL